MMELTGHAALITGSTKGVGRAIAEALARAGADLVLHGRQRGDEAEQAIQACEQHGVNVSFITGDLGGDTQQAVPDVCRSALEAQPNLDLLVNNAGAHIDVPYLEMTYDRFERTMRLNVESGYFLTQALAHHWLENNVSGRVLFVGSINGRLGEENSTAYDISKGAIDMMIKTLCIALAPKGIRVNGVAPGLVHSHATSWLKQNPAMQRWMGHHTPNGRVPDANVCGGGAVYLLSDEAEHTHGQMLFVDGGMSAWQQPDPPTGWA